MNYVLTETLSSTLITWYVLKRLVLPWKEWDAFKVGIIDETGKKIKQPVSSVERDAWTSFDRFMWNLRKILEKFVGGSQLAHYLSAMYLLRDDINLNAKYTNILTEDSNFVDFNLEKQIVIFEFFKEMDKLNLKQLNEFEFDMFMILPSVKSIITKLNITSEKIC